MNRTDFLNELNKYLENLPSDEKADALRYYEELFAEAGVENEQKILADLESPGDIARQILVENGINPDGSPEFVMDSVSPNATKSEQTVNRPQFREKKSNNNIVLVILLLIFTFPFWIGFVAGAFGILVALVAVAFALTFAVGVSGVSLIIAGIIGLFVVPPVGLISLGAGFILTGIGLLIAIPCCKLVIRFIVWLVNAVVNLIRRLFNREAVA